jgi:hypothetical protein
MNLISRNRLFELFSREQQLVHHHGLHGKLESLLEILRLFVHPDYWDRLINESITGKVFTNATMTN